MVAKESIQHYLKTVFVYLIAIGLLLVSLTVKAVVSVDNVSTDTDNNVDTPFTMTVSHTTGGLDRLMIVAVSFNNDDFEVVSSVTYNSTNLTPVGTVNQDDDARVELWAFLAPPVTTADVVITFDSRVQEGAVVGVITFNGVDQSNPYGSFQSESGDSASPSLAVTSAIDEVVLSVLAAEEQDNNPIANSSSNSQWSLKSQNGNDRTAGSGATLVGSTSVNTSWSLNSSDDWVIGAISIRPSSSSSVLRFESGQAILSSTSVSPIFTAVNFTETFTAPPLIFSLPTSDGADPASLRIRNVTSSGFEIAYVEPNPEDGTHPASTADWFAISRGDHTLNDGTRLLAGSIDTTSFQGGGTSGAGWDSITYPTSFSATPIVLAMIQTMNNETGSAPATPSIPWLATALRNVGTASMDIALERAQSNSGSVSTAETIAYLVMDSGRQGNLTAGIQYETISTADNITGIGNCSSSSFVTAYSGTPLVIASQNTRDGSDGGWLRRCSLSSTNVGFVIDEDRDQDNERGHTTERAGVLVISSIGTSLNPLAYYQFEEESWNGTVGEILDSSGNGYHGQVNNNSTPEISLPAIAGNPGTCGYASQSDGAIQITGLPLDSTTVGVKTTITFWMNWDGTNSVMPVGWNLHDIWIFDGSIGFNTSNGDIYGISSAGLANGWHHVAVEFTNGSVTSNRMLIDGVEQVLTQRRSTPNNSRAFVDSELRIGGWSINNGYDFSGLLDEVRVYEGSLTVAQINSIMSFTHNCPEVLNMEAGRADLPDTSISPAFTTVSFSEVFVNPPLVFTLPSNDGADPASLRIRNITTTSFDIAYVEPTPEDGTYPADTVDWFAISSGNHTLPDGTRLLAGSIDTTRFQTNRLSGTSWESVIFSPAFSSTPAVLAMVQSMNNESGSPPSAPSVPWLSTAMQNVTTSSMNLALERSESINGTIGTSETIAYLAMESGRQGTLTGSILYETILTADDIIGLGSCAHSSFVNSYVENPLVFATKNRRDGGDGGWVRRCDLTTTSVGLVIDEDQELDSDRNHTTENAGILVISGITHPIELIAEYRFEETSWNGTPGEILDSSGNGFNGQVNNNASPETILPALTGNPGTCGYASLIDGAIEVTGLPLDTTTIGEKTTVTFWMNWDGTENVMPIGWNLHDIWMVNGVMGFNTGNGDVYGISSAGLANGWHHVTAEFTNGSVTNNRMLIDGVEQVLTQRQSTPNNSRAFVDNELRIGGWSANNSYNFHGLIDEVRVYRSRLSTAQINMILAERHPCADLTVDYFSLDYDSSGIHCLAEPVEVTARNIDNTITADYSGTITLDTQTGSGTWSLTSGAGIFTDTTPNDGLATYIFDSTDNGLAEFELFYSDGITSFNIDVFDGTIRDDDSENDITFGNSGFTITASPLVNPLPSPPAVIDDPIPTQVAGDIFELFLAVYGTTDNDPECGIIESYTGTRTLSLSTNYVNPGSGSLNASGAGSVTFSNGQATLSSQYKDVGRIRIDVSDSEINGSTNSFVVRPDSFEITPSGSNFISTGPNDPDSYTAAGTDFTVDVAAIDSEGDITPNYGNETIPERITLIHSLSTFMPAGSSNGVFTGTLGSAVAGIASGTFNWSEVGIIDLTADVADDSVGDDTYLGTSNVLTVLNDVGRFIPASLEVVVTNSGTFENTCTLGAVPFTYIGQEFQYSSLPAFTVTAKNALSPAGTTVNYTDLFMKLNAGSALTNTVNTDATNTDLDIFHTKNGLSFSDDGGGIATFTNGNDTFIYGPDPSIPGSSSKTSNSEVPPFISDIDRFVNSVIDSDSVSAALTSPGLAFDPLNTSGNELRFGRLNMKNVHGSELVDLQMSMFVEYFTSNGYILNSDDNCTQVTTSDLSVTENLRSPGTSAVTVVSPSLTPGNINLNLTAPGDGLDGTVLVIPNLNLSGDKWLRYNWNNTGQFDSDPSGIATFGIYDGNPVNIYIQQIYQ